MTAEDLEREREERERERKVASRRFRIMAILTTAGVIAAMIGAIRAIVAVIAFLT